MKQSPKRFDERLSRIDNNYDLSVQLSRDSADGHHRTKKAPASLQYYVHGKHMDHQLHEGGDFSIGSTSPERQQYIRTSALK